MRRITTLGLIAAVLALAPAARADIWVEVGDAGSLPATAQNTIGTNPLDAIIGTISVGGANADVDMYLIFIANPAAFSATTVGTPGTLSNTQLFLFDATGRGVYANDDASAATGRSTLPAGPLRPPGVGPTTAGFYYLAISSFDRDPISAPTNNLIFPSFPFTGVFGPTGPGGADPVTGYTGGGAFTGTYRINLTGAEFANVPEPGTWVLFGLGAAGLFGYALRRRRAAFALP